ncbi:BamA/TamA family outer membrane protein [Sediminitomix flava]|uniref:Surface antigen-like protein n=1 Tax=Sediminitomix flava TaxID=379075 RepID=A0A315ZFK7_SEDFL|nr:BamA/TamA family outer membrane protein [Sediminitomix flava]PWJ44102.1 surface antigen-like protein [Sediminitomix flava]
MKRLVNLFFLLLLPLSFLFAQEADTVLTDTTGYEPKSTFFPYASYTPETSVEFGALFLRQFKFANAGEETRPSFYRAWGNYTLNNQMNIGAENNFILPGEEWMFNGFISYKDFPEKFYGFGESQLDSAALMEWKMFYVEQAFMRGLGNGLFVGAQARYFNMWDVGFDDPEVWSEIKALEDYDRILGMGDENTSGKNASLGLGLVMVWDTRNSVLAPSKGFYLELSSYWHSENFGSTQTYGQYKIDGRKYFSFFNGESVLGLHTLMQFTTGDAPFREVGMMGGKLMMRGTYYGQFRDNHMIAFQTEWRQHIYGRWGAVAFAGVGQVAETLGDISASRFETSFGVGLRFNINKKDPANIRVDYGFGPNGGNLYADFGEVF